MAEEADQSRDGARPVRISGSALGVHGGVPAAGRGDGSRTGPSGSARRASGHATGRRVGARASRGASPTRACGVGRCEHGVDEPHRRLRQLLPRSADRARGRPWRGAHRSARIRFIADAHAGCVVSPDDRQHPRRHRSVRLRHRGRRSERHSCCGSDPRRPARTSRAPRSLPVQLVVTAGGAALPSPTSNSCPPRRRRPTGAKNHLSGAGLTMSAREHRPTSPARPSRRTFVKGLAVGGAAASLGLVRQPAWAQPRQRPTHRC